MVTRTYRHAHLVDDGAQIIGMYAINDKRDQTRTLFSLTNKADAVYFRKLPDGRLQQL